MEVIGRPTTPLIVWQTALHSYVMMVRVLIKSAAEERQIEVGNLICLFKEACLKVIAADNVKAAHLQDLLCQMMWAMRALLTEPPTKEAIRQLILDNHVMEAVILILDHCLVITVLICVRTNSNSYKVQYHFRVIQREGRGLEWEHLAPLGFNRLATETNQLPYKQPCKNAWLFYWLKNEKYYK